MREPGNREMRDKNITMTAHVLIALASVRSLTGIAQNEVSIASIKARDYLTDQVQFLTDPFQTALVTWALTTSGGASNDAFTRMQALSRDRTYWSATRIPVNPNRQIQTVPYIDPRQIYPHEASAVQATAYALMCYTSRNLVEESVPLVDWLNVMRNTIGGFAGTRVSTCTYCIYM